MNRFIITIKRPDGYQYIYIHIDDFKDKSSEFYLDLIKNSFPTIDRINNMVVQTRKMGNKLYTTDNLDSIFEICNKSSDIGLVLVYDKTWSIGFSKDVK